MRKQWIPGPFSRSGWGLGTKLQLPEFTSTVATVSLPACLANFTKILGFISKKGLRGALDILLFFIFQRFLSRFSSVPGQKTLSGF